MTIKSSQGLSEIPTICPGCGYEAPGAAGIITHWLRVGAYRERRGEMVFDMKHKEKEHEQPTVVVPEVSEPGPHPRRNGAEVGASPTETGDASSDHLSSVPARINVLRNHTRRQPFNWWRFWFAGLNLMAMSFTLTVVGLYYLPRALEPLIQGPLAPWGNFLVWLWGHGEVSLPAVVILVMAWSLPATRGILWAILVKVTLWTALIVMGLGVMSFLVWVLIAINR